MTYLCTHITFPISHPSDFNNKEREREREREMEQNNSSLFVLAVIKKDVGAVKRRLEGGIRYAREGFQKGICFRSGVARLVSEYEPADMISSTDPRDREIFALMFEHRELAGIDLDFYNRFDPHMNCVVAACNYGMTELAISLIQEAKPHELYNPVIVHAKRIVVGGYLAENPGGHEYQCSMMADRYDPRKKEFFIFSELNSTLKKGVWDALIEKMGLNNEGDKIPMTALIMMALEVYEENRQGGGGGVVIQTIGQRLKQIRSMAFIDHLITNYQKFIQFDSRWSGGGGGGDNTNTTSSLLLALGKLSTNEDPEQFGRLIDKIGDDAFGDVKQLFERLGAKGEDEGVYARYLMKRFGCTQQKL